MSERKSLQLIQNRQLVADEWVIVDTDGGEAGNLQSTALRLRSGSAVLSRHCTPAPTGVPTDAPTLIPLSIWLERRSELLAGKSATGQRIGVWLTPADEPSVLGDDLAKLDLIAVQFPKFSDGRGYSTASLLRQRYGYTGELRAFGDVGRDQLFYLARVGFDSFLISEGRDAAAALSAFDDFPEVYQSATDQALPLFRQRAA